MAVPLGTYPIGGPVVDISGALLTASAALRDAGVISLRNGELMKVNSAGDGWEPVIVTAALITALGLLTGGPDEADEWLIRDSSFGSLHKTNTAALRGAIGNPILPAAAHQVVATNAAGTAYELVDQLTAGSVFPHVAALPDYTLAISPDLVYLDHDVQTGTRSDAIITVGRVGTVGWGWSTIFGGSINQSNPGITGIYGVGDAADYSITEVVGHNRALLDSFNRIVIADTIYSLGVAQRAGALWRKAVTSGPTGLSAATLAVNFLRPDDTYYFVGTGVVTQFHHGLYEKTSTGYSRIISSGFSHIRGIGPPVIDPDYEGQLYINTIGDLWVAGGTLVHTTTAATGTSAVLSNSKYVRMPSTQDEILQSGGDGGFTWPIPLAPPAMHFNQQEGPTLNIAFGKTWEQAWAYITTTSGGDTSANRRLRDDSVFLDGYTNVEDAYHGLGQRIDQAAFDGGTIDYYFGIYGRTPAEFGVRRITTWTQPVSTETDTLFWHGPFWSQEEVVEWVAQNGISINQALVAAGVGLNLSARFEIDKIEHLDEKTAQLHLVSGTERTWENADATEGAAYEGAINFIEHSATPTLAELQALDWTLAVLPHAAGSYWTVFRLPNPAFQRSWYRYLYLGAGGIGGVFGTIWSILHSDATYEYFGFYTTTYEFAQHSIEFDRLVHQTNYDGGLQGHQLIENTRAEFDALTTYVQSAWYIIQETT